MKKHEGIISLTPIYGLVLLGFVMVSLAGNQAVATLAESSVKAGRHTVIIDPGHGGEDGGATSCTGVLESHINLEIALRLNDIVHLLGLDAKMIRIDDRSIYVKGETIAQKKISDLHERVRIVNDTSKAILLSIHQNTFPDGRYWGTQVFYPNTDGSKELASQLQKEIQSSLAPNNNRKIKQSKGVYLMEHIRCTGVLIECGFLSNTKEEAMLRNCDYQKKLCAVIAGSCCKYLDELED